MTTRRKFTGAMLAAGTLANFTLVATPGHGHGVFRHKEEKMNSPTTAVHTSLMQAFSAALFLLAVAGVTFGCLMLLGEVMESKASRWLKAAACLSFLSVLVFMFNLMVYVIRLGF